MKIPENLVDKDDCLRIYKLWRDAADKLSLETGIFIQVKQQYDRQYPVFNRIYFVVDGHEFENLTDLKKAVSNKAFL